MVIIGIQHYKISLLAYFDAADTIRPVQGSSPVQGEGGDSWPMPLPPVEEFLEESVR